MKTILVATDYSECAESAFRYAAFIASFTKADIALFNNYNFNIHALNGLITANAVNAILKDNKCRLEKYGEILSARYNRAVSTCSLTSMTAESLEELIKKLDVSLIVMGMGKNPEEEHLTGITSGTIIKNTSVPVLIVPEGVVLKMPERVLYACDYHALPKEEHLSALKDIALAFCSELQVFHVHNESALAEARTGKDAVLKEIEKAISSIDHTYRDVNTTDVSNGLLDGIKEFDADILVMSPHKYSFWRSMFHKSKTREMIFKSAIPLLSIPS